LSFGIVFSLATGIRKLPDSVASGAFDRFMLSPKNLLMRVATSSFNASAVGDIVFGITCLVIYGFLIHAGLYQILLILALLALATIVFLAMMIAIFSASFYFIDSSAVTNGLFELFLTPSLFHGGAFQGGMRFVFTFLIPSLLIGTIPVESVRDISLIKLGLVGALAVVWLFLSVKIFNRAIRKYRKISRNE
jgi:ABC-2 type transport system permease protein